MFRKTVEAIAGLKAEDRVQVAHACYKSALLCFDYSPPKFCLRCRHSADIRIAEVVEKRLWIKIEISFCLPT